MSEFLHHYCCVKHRDERLSTVNLIGFLSKAYQQAFTLLKAQSETMKQCRNTRDKHDYFLLQKQEEEIENMDPILHTVQQLLEQIDRPANKVSSQQAKIPTITVENDSHMSPSNFESEFDVTVVDDKTEVAKANENEILMSPVFKKRPAKSKKSTLIPDPGGSVSTDYEECELVTSPVISIESNDKCDDVKRVILCETNHGNETSLYNSSLVNYNNSDVIQCTPVQKSYKKIGLSNLYNVDTTISQTGKKLKQAILSFEPVKENIAVTVREKSLNIKKQNCPQVDKGLSSVELSQNTSESQSTEEEIIEDSPTHSVVFSKQKNRPKLKKRDRQTNSKSLFGIDDNTTPKKKFRESVCVPLKEMNSMCNISQFSPPFSSTQKDPFVLSKKSHTIAAASTEFGKKVPYLSTALPIGAKASNVSKETISSPAAGISASSQDETFFASTEVNAKQDLNFGESNATENIHLQSAKRNLQRNFNIVPAKSEKKVDNYKTCRTKEERAQMQGIDCWECREYYKNSGLTDEQIKARLKTCSRHRANYSERPDTPEGLWDVAFPDTMSSTYQSS